MKLIRKWLFPMLTCLIVASAAALPPYVSQVRDEGQFGAVHTEAMDLGALPVREAAVPDLFDRMDLYANQYSWERPVLSSNTGAFSDGITREERALTLQRLLIEADLIAPIFFDEYVDEPFEQCSESRLLLWDPAGEWTIQEPSCYYLFAWTSYETYHNKSLSVTVDTETGLPIDVNLFDTNLSVWCPYTKAELDRLVDRYFALMGWTIGVDVEPLDYVDPKLGGWYRSNFAVVGTDLRYSIVHGATTLDIRLESTRGDLDNWNYTDG